MTAALSAKKLPSSPPDDTPDLNLGRKASFMSYFEKSTGKPARNSLNKLKSIIEKPDPAVLES